MPRHENYPLSSFAISVRRLLIDNPDNPVFYWLSLYSSLLLKDMKVEMGLED